MEVAAFARMLLAVLCLQLLVPSHAQTEFVELYAMSIDQLQAQEAEVHQRERAQVLANPTGPVAVTIGDSITAFGYQADGWATLISKHLQDFMFVNKGVPMGSSRRALLMTRWTTSSPQSLVAQQLDRIKLVTLCYGANDAAVNTKKSTWRMVPVDEYKANLMESINIFRSNNVSNILLLTPPPAASPPRIDRRLEVTAEYAAAVHQLGQEMNVPVVDIFSAIQAVPNWQTTLMVNDGLHLSPAGNQLVYQGVKAAIGTNFHDLSSQ